jgi:iron complex transport system ATP-binding protein
LGELLAAAATVPFATTGTVLVAHHVEEVPAGFAHELLLDRGRVAAAGRLDDVLSPRLLSDVFGLPLAVDRRHVRYAPAR